MVVVVGHWIHICNLSTWKVETEGWKVQGQPGIHSEILPSKKKKKERTFMNLVP
jgi:hypothetical protein